MDIEMTPLEKGRTVAVEKREFWIAEEIERPTVKVTHVWKPHETRPEKGIHVISHEWHEQEMARLRSLLVEANHYLKSQYPDDENGWDDFKEKLANEVQK